MRVTITWITWCLFLVANANPANIEPAKMRHLMKKTYCEELKGQKVYTKEELETDCSEKVQIFGNQVNFKG